MVSLALLFIVVALVLTLMEMSLRSGTRTPVVWAVFFLIVAVLFLHLPKLNALP